MLAKKSHLQISERELAPAKFEDNFNIHTFYILPLTKQYMISTSNSML
jgi:hypothetical protein